MDRCFRSPERAERKESIFFTLFAFYSLPEDINNLFSGSPLAESLHLTHICPAPSVRQVKCQGLRGGGGGTVSLPVGTPASGEITLKETAVLRSVAGQGMNLCGTGTVSSFQLKS